MHLAVPCCPYFIIAWVPAKHADHGHAIHTRLAVNSFFALQNRSGARVGGDWGAFISFFLGAQHADHCQAIHTNLPYSSPNLYRPWHVAQTLNGVVPFLNKVQCATDNADTA